MLWGVFKRGNQNLQNLTQNLVNGFSHFPKQANAAVLWIQARTGPFLPSEDFYDKRQTPHFFTGTNMSACEAARSTNPDTFHLENKISEKVKH